MVTQSIKKNTKKDKQVLMFVNIAHTLNFISKKAAEDILRQYKKTGAVFEPTSYMLDKKYINEPDLISLEKSLHAFETIQEDTRFGALCVSFNFLTNSNLEFALREQRLLTEQGKNIKLGELLTEAGMTSMGQRHLVLIKQKTNLKAIEKLSEANSKGEKNFRANKEIMREIIKIPPKMKVDDVLREMQRMKMHMAVIQSKEGKIIGLVTMEDLIEEIFGEIQDEHDIT